MALPHAEPSFLICVFYVLFKM